MAITPKSGITIPRRSVAGMEGMWAKMWDPPRDSPTTPDLVAATNPVPAFMAAPVTTGPNEFRRPSLGRVNNPNTVERTLLNGLSLPTWDGQKVLDFMVLDDPDFGAVGSFPGPTVRIPRGAIFHGETQGKGPPPHTIHWHGIEPTPMNDGVGHCSMEIGQYIYQWQPNFIGSYFYHCHRNTVQHFEFGLYGFLIVEPPDAYDPTIPNVAGETTKNVGGYPRRTAANTALFPQFPGFVSGDPVFGVTGPGGIGVGHPHAFTIPYDREALWVVDDRDSVWSDLAMNAKSFYPGGAATADGPPAAVDPITGVTIALPAPVRPGVDDQFPQGFFNDFNADYWFVTGVPVPGPRLGTGTISNGNVVPPELNGGVTGMQVDIDAQRGETILLRYLVASYNSAIITFPLDVVIIAFDGRALGVPPFNRYSSPFILRAGTPFRLSTARRFDALIRSDTQIDDFATVEFIETRGQHVLPDKVLMTARIPIRIN
jgi:hypothetical protein